MRCKPIRKWCGPISVARHEAYCPLLASTAIETFYGPIQAIRGVSLQVAQGQIVTVLGANGAGKTTVLRTVSGVLDPERGRSNSRASEIGHMPPDQRHASWYLSCTGRPRKFPVPDGDENLMMGSYTRHDKDEVHRDLELCFGYFPV